MDAYATIYIGAVVEFDDFFTKHEECLKCRRKINNPRRKTCPDCKSDLTDPDSKIQLWTPTAYELLGLPNAKPLDEDGWDEHVLSVDWGPEMSGTELELFRATFSEGAPLLLGLEFAMVPHWGLEPHIISLDQLAKAFAEVKAALEKYSLGDRPIQQWTGCFIS